MSLIERNILCLRSPPELSVEERWLQSAYKNIMEKLVEGCLQKRVRIKEDKEETTIMEFDPFARDFHGIERVTADYGKSTYFEAFLGATSYYHASKGGRGAVLEKIIAHRSGDKSVTGLKLGHLPIWLEIPEIIRKGKLFGVLEKEDRSKKRKIEKKWKWIGTKDQNKTINLVNLLDSRLILLEVKNRVDSGGTDARRGAFGKFTPTLELILNNKALYDVEEGKLTFLEFLRSFNVKSLEMYLGFLYNIDGTPATIDGDKKDGFFGDGEKRLEKILQLFGDRSIETKRVNEDRLVLVSEINGIKVKVGMIYGRAISDVFSGGKFSLDHLKVIEKFDDMWLSLIVCIKERSLLLEQGVNYIKIIMDIVLADKKIKALMGDFLRRAGDVKILEKVVEFIMENYREKFKDLPSVPNLDKYIADIIYILAPIKGKELTEITLSNFGFSKN